MMSIALPTHSTTAGTADALSDSHGLRWRIHDAVILAFLVIMVGRSALPALQEANFGISVDANGGVTIRDLAAHVNFTRDFWLGKADYSVASHVKTTDAWAGQPVGVALPFGYSPTMFYLLGPFCLVPTVWSYFFWTLISAAAVWWMTRRGRSWPVITPLVLLSPLALVCFSLGQTSLLTTLVILLLFLRHMECTADRIGSLHTLRGDLTLRADIIDALLLWTLTAKPPLAIAAGVALLAGRRWRAVTFGVLFTAVTTLALTPQLGWDWPSQYLHLASNYDRQTADAAFAWSLRPDYMTNFRALLWSVGVGDALAAGLATLAWLTTSLGLALIAVWKRLDPRFVWPLAVLSYLIFFPHVTSTEDLHLVLLVAVLATTGGLIITGQHVAVIGFVLLVVFLAPGIVLETGGARIALLLTAKLAIAALWLRFRFGQRIPPTALT